MCTPDPPPPPPPPPLPLAVESPTRTTTRKDRPEQDTAPGAKPVFDRAGYRFAAAATTEAKISATAGLLFVRSSPVRSVGRSSSCRDSRAPGDIKSELGSSTRTDCKKKNNK
ncbi:unnamed protein product [Soboliphyme baturini]|uniref:Uncharacterized protein n=1 Tax=Soboliphyme baturini TaxID=241478 RepID=A0A183IAS4_9BILA|nr:unnamed protein product [Soboliphyme baturini]